MWSQGWSTGVLSQKGKLVGHSHSSFRYYMYLHYILYFANLNVEIAFFFFLGDKNNRMDYIDHTSVFPVDHGNDVSRFFCR